MDEQVCFMFLDSQYRYLYLLLYLTLILAILAASALSGMVMVNLVFLHVVPSIAVIVLTVVSFITANTLAYTWDHVFHHDDLVLEMETLKNNPDIKLYSGEKGTGLWGKISDGFFSITQPLRLGRQDQPLSIEGMYGL